MKQKDILLIVVVVIVSGIFSLIVTQQIFGTPAKNQETAEVVQKISSDFDQPDKQYFNKDSLNPTRQITIDRNDNQNPFNSQSAN